MTNTISKIIHNGDEFEFDTSSVSGITTTQPSNPSEGAVYYDTTNDVVKVYDGTNWVEVGKEYSAGKGISIGDVTINGRQGPSSDGFHVPSTTEWEGVNTIMTSLSLTIGDDWRINLHLPFAGCRLYSNASLNSQGSYGYYWSSSPNSASSYNARFLYLYSSNVNADYYYSRAYGSSVRCFKDSYVTPDSSWTVVQGTLGSAGIFWNQSEGLISITNGTTGYTIMDKNLGATVVYNNGDTLTQANMGNMYQWGNNYGFPSTGTISNTSSTQVDASNYGPTNPYSSDTFITGSNDWSSVANDDLWGDTTGTYTLENAISNIGVLSVNGQTGDVTVAGGITKIFELSSLTDLTTAQAAYDWYVNDGNPILHWSIFYLTLSTYNNSLGLMKFSNIRSNSATTNGVWLNAAGLDITVSNGSVTGITSTQNNINIKTSAPTGVGNETITLVI